MFPLTETQLAVLDFIAKHICEFQRPPTMADISRRRGWSSPSTAAKCVEAIERKGYVERYRRSIRVKCWPHMVCCR